jgi:ribosome-binding protein aMBF1 (putative translation factor)
MTMPVCRSCEDDVDELVPVKAGGRRIKVCEDCAERLREEAEVSEMSETVIKDMMGYKGRR